LNKIKLAFDVQYEMIKFIRPIDMLTLLT